MGVNPDRYDRHDRHAHHCVPGMGRPEPQFSPRRKPDLRVVFNVDISIQKCIIESSGCDSWGGPTMAMFTAFGFALILGAVMYLLGGMLLRRPG